MANKEIHLNTPHHHHHHPDNQRASICSYVSAFSNDSNISHASNIGDKEMPLELNILSVKHNTFNEINFPLTKKDSFKSITSYMSDAGSIHLQPEVPDDHNNRQDRFLTFQKRRSRRESTAQFRKFFNRLTPMYTDDIKALSEKDKLALHWSGRFDYRLFVCAMLVGLGNWVRFPLYILKYGTLPFVTAYIIMCIVMGYPIILLEAGLGQFCSHGPGGCWEFAKLFTGVGYVMILYVIIRFNQSFFRDTVRYMLMQYFLKDGYPWHSENQEMYTFAEEWLGLNITHFSKLDVDVNQTRYLTTENNFHRHNGNLFRWQELSICYFVSWVIVIIMLLPDIHHRGKIVSKIFALCAVSYCVICVRSVTLSGAKAGIQFGLFRRSGISLQNYKVWLDAFELCFFSLALIPGYHMTVASYNHFNNRISDDVFFFLSVDLFFHGLGVLMTFSLLGHLAEKTTFNLEYLHIERDGLTVDNMIMILLPQSMACVEGSGYAWVFFFFTIINITLHINLTTVFELTITGVIDVFKFKKTNRKYVVVGVCSIMSVLYLWMCTEYMKEVDKMLDYYVNTHFTPIFGLGLVVPLIYALGVDRIIGMLECAVGWNATPLLSNRWWRLLWKASWNYIVPSVYVATSVIYLYEDYTRKRDPLETWMMIIGNLIIVIFALVLFGTMTYYIATTDQGGVVARLRFLTRPSPNWGPLLPQNRYIMKVGEEDRLEEKLKKRQKKQVITDFDQLARF